MEKDNKETEYGYNSMQKDLAKNKSKYTNSKNSRIQSAIEDKKKMEKTKKILRRGLAAAIMAGSTIITGVVSHNIGLSQSRQVPYTFDVSAQGTKVFEEQINSDNSLMDIHNHLTRYNELKGRENNLTPDEQKELEDSYNFFKENYASESLLRRYLELPLYKSMLISRYNLDLSVDDLKLENHNPDKYEDGYCDITVNGVTHKINETIPILYNIDKNSNNNYFDKNNNFDSNQFLKDLKTIGKELKHAEFPSEKVMKDLLGDKYIEPNSENDKQKFNIEEYKKMHNNLDKGNQITNINDLSDNNLINEFKNNERG